MKINNLLESSTPTSDASNITTSAPEFGRDDNTLEETTAGPIATVASPVGKVRSRGSIFSGIKTSEKFPNTVDEDLTDEGVFGIGSNKSQQKTPLDYKAVRQMSQQKGPNQKFYRPDEYVKQYGAFAEEQLDEVDPHNFDSDEDYYAAVRNQGKQKFSGDWDVWDEIASLENQLKYTKSSALAHTLHKQIDQLKSEYGIEDDEQLDEKSVSKAQFRTMAAAAHNPEFAKKVGISQKVGKEFHKADRKQDYKDLPAKVDEEQVDENLRDWFKEKWVRFGPDGKIRGSCARGDDSEGKPKCLPQAKAHSLGKKGRASAAARKRREDPNPERSGKAINVNTKKKSNEGMSEGSLAEMDKSAPQPGRDGRVSHSTYGSRDKSGSKGPEKEAKPITAKKAKQDALDILKKQGVAEGLRGTGNPGMPTPYDQGHNDAKKGIAYDNPYNQPGEEQEHNQYKKGYEQGKKQGMAEGSLEEYGDTNKGQKMLGKVHHRAANRVTSKQADKDPAYARKAQQTQDRAWDRLAVKEQGVAEAELDEACWKGYHKEGNKKMFGKTYPNCVKNTNEEQLDEKCWDTHKQVGMKNKGGKMVPNCVPKESVEEVSEQWTKLPNGNYRNMHTGVQQSKPPVKKKRNEKTGAEWDAIEKAKKDKEQGVAEGSLNEFAPPDSGDDRNYEYEVYQCNPNDQFDWIGGPIYKSDDMGKVHSIAYNLHKKHPDKAFMIWQERSQGSRGGYGIKDDEQGVAEEKCPHCGGAMFSEMIMNEKKDACYYKVKSRYKVWPSAYASGALVKCRKKGASNWGNKSESVNEDEISEEKLAQELFKDLQIFKKGKDKTIGNKSKSKDLSDKPKDRDIVVKEGSEMKFKEIISEAANPAQQAAIAIAMKKKGQKPKNENAEYDDEAGMADNNLETLRRAVEGIDELINSGDNLPEWCQEKIAVSKSMLVAVWDYMKSEEDRGALAEEFDLIESIVESIAVRNNVNSEAIWEDLESLTDDELYVFAVTSEPINEDWQKANKKDRTDGMSPKAVKAYRRENPGSKLKTAVTTKPSKLKKGSKASKRRKSYCSRSRGQMKMHNISCSKTPDKAICKARRRWNC